MPAWVSWPLRVVCLGVAACALAVFFAVMFFREQLKVNELAAVILLSMTGLTAGCFGPLAFAPDE